MPMLPNAFSPGRYSLDLLTLGDLAGSFGALILLDNFFRFRDQIPMNSLGRDRI
jgi:hypothetical protein